MLDRTNFNQDPGFNQEPGKRRSHTRDNGLLDRLVESTARKLIDRLAEDVSPATWQRIIDYAGERFGRVSIDQGGREGRRPTSASDAQATSGSNSDTASVRASANPDTTDDTAAVDGTDRTEAAAAQSKGDATPGDRDLLNVHEFAALIGAKSAQTVRNRLRQRRLIGWKNERGAFVLPAGQINQHKRPLPGLNEVITVFGNGHAAWDWLTATTLDNGRTPLEALQSGGFQVVEHAAHAASPETATPT